MSRIFISYRREDCLDVAGRIFDRLCADFGSESVFMDIDNIPFGVDFRKHIQHAVGQCDVLLAVIGSKWLDLRGPSETGSGTCRRLDNPSDFVRIEIESALQRDIAVIPILVGDARMPSAEQLPESLRNFAFRNAAEIRSGRDFHIHMNRLIDGLKSNIPDTKKSHESPIIMKSVLSNGQAASSSDVAAQMVGKVEPVEFRVLIVEESIIRERVAKKLIQEEGYVAVIVSDGERAITAAQEANFDAFLIQMQMRAMDGFLVAQQIRNMQESPTYKHTLIYGMSNDKTVQVKCDSAGFDGCFSRPVHSSEIQSMIASDLNYEEALEAVGGDSELLCEVIMAMLEELPLALDYSEKHLSTGTFHGPFPLGLRSCAHTIAGGMRLFDSGQGCLLRERSLAMENAAKMEALEEGRSLFPGLVRECHRVLAAFRLYLAKHSCK